MEQSGVVHAPIIVERMDTGNQRGDDAVPSFNDELGNSPSEVTCDLFQSSNSHALGLP